MPLKPQIDSHRVFLNVPYEDSYQKVFLGLLSALVCLGRKPVIVAEVPDEGKGRLPRIYDELLRSRVSIHDLGCVDVSPPRFNMPFELGLAWTIQRHFSRQRYEVYVLESKKYRLQETLSDWNGIDPKIHEDDPSKAIAAVLDCLGRHHLELTVREVLHVYKGVCELLDDFKAKHAGDSVYSARIFREIVATMVLMAKDAGFLK